MHTVPGAPGHWPLRVSMLGPGSQHPSHFTDERVDLQKTKQLKPHSEDAARPGLWGGQPDAGSAPEPTGSCLHLPAAAATLPPRLDPARTLEDLQVKSLHSPAAGPGTWPFSGELEAAPASAS